MTDSELGAGFGATWDVVVGVDHSLSSHHAARWSVCFPGSVVARVRLVHVIPAGAASGPGSEPMPTWLAELAAATSCPGVEVSGEVVQGDIGTALAELAGSASVLVVGSDGEGSAGGLRVGRVGMELLDRARCPVAVVRGGEPGASPPGRGEVVVGVDGTAASASALDLAAHLADGWRTPMLAVHTWADVGVEPELGISRVPRSWDVLAAEANSVLDEALAPVRARFPTLEIRSRVVGDNPVRALIDIAARARIVVVGTRGVLGPRGMLGRSTSRTLVEFAPCPVLVAS